ncbi:MAG: hypothetical protein KAR42_13580 [candidate division Zixibacteria bacterium]|nr:hypothetical protein [candidate division Zixibacteria bacterium]
MKYLLVLITILLCLGSYLCADVTVTSESTINTMGMSMGGGTVKTYLSGEKMRMENTAEITPAIQLSMNTPAKSFTITRLDKGVSWLIYDIDSSYAETSVSDTKERMDEAKSAMPQNNLDSLKTAWEITSNRLRDSTINDFECQGMTVTGELIIKGMQQIFDYTFWVTENFPGYDEITSFSEKAATLSGMETTNNIKMMEDYLITMGINVTDLEKHTENLDGYIIRTSMKLYSKMNMNLDMPLTSSDSSIIDKTKQEEDTAQSMEDMFAAAEQKDTIMEQAMQQLLSAMKTNSKDGLTETMSITTEVKSIEISNIDPALFEIPPGYKKF